MTKDMAILVMLLTLHTLQFPTTYLHYALVRRSSTGSRFGLARSPVSGVKVSSEEDQLVSKKRRTEQENSLSSKKTSMKNDQQRIVLNSMCDKTERV